MIKRRFLLSLFFIPLIIFGIALGIWQYQRSLWKENLLLEYNTKLSQKPTMLPTLVIRLKGDKDSVMGNNNDLFKELELMPITLTGHFLPNLVFYRPVHDGIELITAFDTNDGIIAVNAGVMPYAAKEIPINKIIPREPLTITGFYRIPEIYGDKTPDNRTLVAKIPFGAYATTYTDKALAGAIQIDDETKISDLLKGRSASYFIKNIPNNHLQYMGTWFLLSGVGLVIYIILWQKMKSI